MPETKRERVTPPYGSFKTVKSFIAQLAKTVYPDAIDRHMLKGMSGATQSEVLSALRFLGCIDDRDRTTPVLKALVSMHGKEGWATTLKDAIDKAYKPVVGAVNIKSGSAKQLNDAFKKSTGTDGFMLARHVRFLLTALKDAGVMHSPHFRVPSVGKKKSGQKSAAKPAKKTPKGRNHLDGNGGDDDELPPAGTQKYPLFFRNKPAGSIIVPKDLSLADCKVIELQLAVLKAYASDESDK